MTTTSLSEVVNRLASANVDVLNLATSDDQDGASAREIFNLGENLDCEEAACKLRMVHDICQISGRTDGQATALELLVCR